ncbi:MAG: hypothetical protein ABR907_01375 [Terracidiphilus sp.]
MHIHGNSMNFNAASFYSAGQNEKAAATERAAQVRKKLLKGAFQIEDAGSPEETLLIGHWLDSRHSQIQSEDSYYSTVANKDTDFESIPPAKPGA